MTKQKTAVVVDSTATIPEELVARHNLHVIPQIVNWSGVSYYDNIDIKPKEFYERLATAQEMPTTSQPSAGEFYNFFQKVAETAESIVCCTISNELSGTLASAHAAAEMMGDFPIEVVDSRSASMGLGFIAMAAARAVAAGADHKAAAEAARRLIEPMRVIFVVDTLEFLHRGGRIGGAQRLIGSMLSIKPVLHLQNGRIEPLASVRTKRKAINHALDTLSTEAAGQTNLHVTVIGASDSDEVAYMLNEVRQRVQPVDLLQAELSPVIGTHVGPGAVGVIYYADSMG